MTDKIVSLKLKVVDSEDLYANLLPVENIHGFDLKCKKKCGPQIAK